MNFWDRDCHSEPYELMICCLFTELIRAAVNERSGLSEIHCWKEPIATLK
ncbi:unnamed protein product [Acanthoscelides obtectus]|uniref:Uncharacterized protein n=1 Tax=Acanthoscelides obtectus TaxID=200917 RepID=A0A9P0P233_ACAOB|nr:unnamed protein product [Acanthoscelides obtectus]CAK1622906.1 hypothetical protein AOBTE_LOCUS1723 [Acanthoscelides obtectus]